MTTMETQMVRVRGNVYSSREAAVNAGWPGAEYGEWLEAGEWIEGWMPLAPLGWDDD